MRERSRFHTGPVAAPALVFLISNFFVTSLYAQVRLSEVAAVWTPLVDGDGESSDWVELENAGAAAVDLGGWGLGNDGDERKAWRFPAGVVLPAGGFLVVFCSGKDLKEPAELHTYFRLNGEGEDVVLFEPGGARRDGVRYPAQVWGMTYARRSGEASIWAYNARATPGAKNAGPSLEARPWVKPEVASRGGFYNAALRVRVSMEPALDVRYTLDGREPGPEDPLFPAHLAVERTTILRCAAFAGGERVGQTTTETYLFEAPHEIAVMSLVMAPGSLFDSREGIYTNPGGRGRQWERAASVELFAPSGAKEVGLGTGLRIHGNSSRGGEKKSFRLYFRGEYGSGKLRHAVFPAPGAAEEFDQLVLRSGNADSGPLLCADEVSACPTHLRDRLNHEIFRRLGQLAPHGRPVALYLNGEYWGIYDLLERIHAGFLNEYLGPGHWDIVDARGQDAAEGDLAEWRRLHQDLARADLASPEATALLHEEVDQGNMAAYLALLLWSREWDWVGNFRAVRERRPGAKWRLVPWDAEAGQRCIRSDVPFLLSVSILQILPSFALKSILGSLASREVLRLELERALGDALAPGSYRQLVEELRQEMRPEVPREVGRWGGSIDAWEKAVDSLASYASCVEASLDEDLWRFLSPLDVAPSEAPAFERAPRVALVGGTAAFGPPELAVSERLVRRGAQVTMVHAVDADPRKLAKRFDLAIILPGVESGGSGSAYPASELPVVLCEGSLLSADFPLARQLRRTTGDALQAFEDHPRVGLDLPRWGLQYLEAPEPLWVTRGIVSQGTLRFACLNTAPRNECAVLLAERGSRYTDGREVKARVAYFAMNDFRTLSGHGVLLFDRVVDWALGAGQVVPFMRGDLTGDGRVETSDVLEILRDLFLAGPQPACWTPPTPTTTAG